MKTTYIINTLLTLALTANAYSADHTTAQVADGITLNFNNGDSIVSTASPAATASNGGRINISGAAHIETTATGRAYAVRGENDSIIGLGDGSTIISGGDAAIRTFAENSTITGTNLTIETRQSSNITVFASNGFIDLGENSKILTPNTVTLATSGSGHFQATSLTVVNTLGRGMDILGSSNAYIGTGSSITTSSANGHAFSVFEQANLTIEGSNVKSAAKGITLSTSGSLNVINSNISGGTFGICAYATVDGLGALYKIQGGSVTSVAGPAIAMDLDVGGYPGSGTTTFLINGGARISGGNGVFFESFSRAQGSSIVILEGAGTVALGRFVASGSTNTASLSIKDGAKWDTAGVSNMDSLLLDGANVNFTFSAATDKVQASALTFGASKSDINIGLADAFAALIFLDPLGEFIFAIDDTFAGSTADAFEASANVNIATSSENYSWLSEYLGNGQYRLYNFQIIPEASTYAAVAGVLALAFAAYRRRN